MHTWCAFAGKSLANRQENVSHAPTLNRGDFNYSHVGSGRLELQELQHVLVVSVLPGLGGEL